MLIETGSGQNPSPFLLQEGAIVAFIEWVLQSVLQQGVNWLVEAMGTGPILMVVGGLCLLAGGLALLGLVLRFGHLVLGLAALWDLVFCMAQGEELNAVQALFLNSPVGVPEALRSWVELPVEGGDWGLRVGLLLLAAAIEVGWQHAMRED